MQLQVKWHSFGFTKVKVNPYITGGITVEHHMSGHALNLLRRYYSLTSYERTRTESIEDVLQWDII